MKKQSLMPAFLVVALILGIMAVNALDVTSINTNNIIPKNIEKLKEMIPNTFAGTDVLIAPIRNRFLLWTNDGQHVMWGFYGNGYFSGTDNLGKNAWGIYEKGIFVGFYDNELFYGMYKNNNWKAMNLFNEKMTNGRYLTFPAVPVVLPMTTVGGGAKV